jgi:hypothetical protein
MHHLKAALTIKCLPKLVPFAVATNLLYQVPRIRFDTNSFIIGVDTYALITLGNHMDQFKDLKIHSDKDDTEVEGIKEGLEIKGTGTFKFHIKDDDRGVHLIKIPNSKYVPDLKVCLLLPHHWAQEAKDHYPLPKGTKMEEDDEALMLIWKQFKHRQTIPYHPLTNSAKGHHLIFCGVNAHFQNGIAEKTIRDLCQSARKQLLHVRQQWLAAIHLALWQYALSSAVHLHNTISVLEDGTSRLEHFSFIRIGSKMWLPSVCIRE